MSDGVQPEQVRVSNRRFGWDDCCCGGQAPARISHLPVPFMLRIRRTHDGEAVVIEPGKQLGRSMQVLAFAFGLLAMFGWVGVLVRLKPTWLVLGNTLLLTLAALFIFVLARNASSRIRRVVFLEKRMELSIQTVRRNGEIESECRRPIKQCRLSLHEVCLSASGVSPGTPLLHVVVPRSKVFEGWLVRVSVGDRCFTVACCKRREDALEYANRLPAWLAELGLIEGEPATGMLFDQWPGRPPDEYWATERNELRSESVGITPSR